MTLDICHRKSTDEWVYAVSGITSSTNYVFRYPHYYKIIAWFIFKLNSKKDIAALDI